MKLDIATFQTASFNTATCCCEQAAMRRAINRLHALEALMLLSLG